MVHTYLVKTHIEAEMVPIVQEKDRIEAGKDHIVLVKMKDPTDLVMGRVAGVETDPFYLVRDPIVRERDLL